jgi:hypothetical protein
MTRREILEAASEIVAMPGYENDFMAEQAAIQVSTGIAYLLNSDSIPWPDDKYEPVRD